MSLSDAVHWAGLAACGVGVLLGLAAHSYAGDFVRLCSAKRLGSLRELSQMTLPAVVALRGRADSPNALLCEHVPGLRAVLLETHIEQQFLRRCAGGEWEDGAALVEHTHESASFYIEDAGARVWILGAAAARRLRSATVHVHDKFTLITDGNLRWLKQQAAEIPPFKDLHARDEYLRGLRMLGKRTTERALPAGVHAADLLW